MVAAVHYYADPQDTHDLLTYLGEGSAVELRLWSPYEDRPSGVLGRRQAAASRQVAIVSAEFGGPALIRDPNDPALTSNSRAAVFNRLNFERRRDPTTGIVDANRSPVLFWEPARIHHGELLPGSIGSQADVLREVSAEYERWVNRVMGWVRRHATPVWGLQRAKVRPDLNIENPYLNTLYALPGALDLLTTGRTGR